MGAKRKIKKEYAVQWLRPDGWWEAGRGWGTKRHAEKDAAEQLPRHCTWRVVRVGSCKDQEVVSDD